MNFTHLLSYDAWTMVHGLSIRLVMKGDKMLFWYIFMLLWGVNLINFFCIKNWIFAVKFIILLIGACITRREITFEENFEIAGINFVSSLLENPKT